MPAVLQVRDLRTSILKRVSFTLSAAECIAVKGPSGAGKTLLLDEPTAALDAASEAAVESLISSRIQAGVAVLWVTHNEAQAKRIARRRLVVEAGRVCQETDQWPAT